MKIRVVRPWKPLTFAVGGFLFSTELAAEDADALVCEWAPSAELESFDGPSSWYTCEPRTNPRMGVLGHDDQRRWAAKLAPERQLHHANEDQRFRIPHVTHESDTTFSPAGSRLDAACCVVSNFGGAVHRRWPAIRLRNRFATQAGVDLYGRRDKWRWYRPTLVSVPRLPSNFVGDLPDLEAKLRTLATYRVCICLENTVEPYYFTEKFVDGVRAGTVPVYHAHPTVRDGILGGAWWVDPAEFEFDPERTVRHALSLNREEVAERNEQWLRSDPVRATRHDAVWRAIGEALEFQSAARSEAHDPRQRNHVQ